MQNMGDTLHCIHLAGSSLQCVIRRVLKVIHSATIQVPWGEEAGDVRLEFIVRGLLHLFIILLIA